MIYTVIYCHTLSRVHWRKTSTEQQGQQVGDETDEELVTSRPVNECLEWVQSYRELDEWQQVRRIPWWRSGVSDYDGVQVSGQRVAGKCCAIELVTMTLLAPPGRRVAVTVTSGGMGGSARSGTNDEVRSSGGRGGSGDSVGHGG